jgi:hypothetical protein
LDIIGREVEESKLELIRGLNTKEVNLNEMPSGQYLLLISSERGLAVEKLIIK